MISGSFLKYFTAILLALNGLILSAHSKLEKAQEELKVLESLAHQSNKGLLRLDSWKEKEEWLKDNPSELFHFTEKNGRLDFWNTQLVNPARIYNSGFYRLSNGWYELIVDTLEAKVAYTLIPIYQHFNYHNDFLEDKISPVLKISGTWNILKDSTTNSEVLLSENNDRIYFLKGLKDLNEKGSDYWLVILVALLLILTLLFLPKKFRLKWISIPLALLAVWTIYQQIHHTKALTDFAQLLSFNRESIFFYITIALWILVLHLSLQLFWIKNKSLSFVLISTFIYSLLLAGIGESYRKDKELELRIEHIVQHANERDQLIENLLLNIDSVILKDEKVKKLAADPWDNQEALEKHFNGNYFAPYWSKFQVRVTAFYKGDSMLVQPDDQVVACHEYFDQQIEESGEKLKEDLWFIKNVEGISAYLMELKLGPKLRLVLELDSRIDEKGLGFPDLLIDTENQTKPYWSGYSYARYYENQLLDQYGEYDFHYQLPDEFSKRDSIHEVIESGHSHLIYHYGDDKSLIISKPVNDLQAGVTSFSYQFAWLSLFMGLLYLLWWLFSNKEKVQVDFKSRMQISMVGILMVSLVLVASGTIYYLVQQHNLKNKLAIQEKIKSVQIELEHKLGVEEELTANQQEYIQYLMIKFSKVFFTDINLFDMNGNLLASSQPKLYNEGLISTKVNPEAYKQILHEYRSSFAHKERIGDLSFLSVYVPFTNDNGEVMAILNLPYFSQQNVLQNQVNQFLVTIINIYVFLMVLGAIITLFIYQRLTRPIRLIQEQFTKLTLQGGNELLDWKGNDEFGQLIKAYNKLLLELSDSADKLARSEREGAWKEMAKQVAHEIKNPLTPMKLSIQHFQMTANPSAEDFQDRLKTMSNNLVEQIDILSNIATEFSSFAKLPDAKFEEVDLRKTLETTSSLYQNEIKISLDLGTDEVKLKADKDQLTRVFNNLIKNAIQATGENGSLEIALSDGTSFGFAKDRVVVHFKDNGHGIDAETAKKIFVPNFTTKNSGSGLGLAMVKSILEQMGAEISFESEVGVGTVFRIVF